MGMQVCAGAAMQCSFGAAPSTLAVLPANKVVSTTPAANVLDNKPIVNVPPFGPCSAPSNPAVIAATAAAAGVPTPAPCVPVIPAPWVPGSPKVRIGGAPALDQTSKLTCNWGGVIQLVVPGQTKVIDA